ncbi:SusC/RagA family TonB-linked outer membrane protein [Pedobacter polaris]|uniref:SusC/RagA family TonB-linked outer membrane protein n=1 Tax=Pedobacter polaris TaxID=2571273 RepID=A0A4U1CVP2_9SPHI|nr:SusC/RagA family TonB-linked outer membrane protein [Pedobacter polaris]TKC09978.1 SusC/RagA family TonB-linked outer membrane protein [Pedobacter polaris]
MNRKFILILFGFLLFATVTFAQKTIRGKVVDATDGKGIPGVSVLVKGTTSGATTQTDGSYAINVPSDGTTLVFKYLGFATQEVAIGSKSEINITLASSAETLEGVIVTALGIKRSEKSVGYSVQVVKGGDLTMTKDNNVIGALAGKIAGAQVTGSSGANLGGTQKIKLRGVNSVTGGGSPLIVIDGTPFNNGNFSNSDANGVDLGNLAQDLNPEDIETISVLKGPAAAALYGSRGQYGAILYTTKKGKEGKMTVEFNTSNMMEKVGNFTPMQNIYGVGNNQTFLTFGATTPLSGQKYVTGNDESWGPKMDGTPIRMYFSFYPQDSRFGQLTPFSPQPNNIKDFYETGFNTNNGITIAGGNEKINLRLSYNNTYIKGTYPNTNLKRNNLGLSSSIKITEKLTAGANLNYANNDGIRPVQGYQGSFTGASQWFQRNIDIKELKDYKYPDGTIKNWNVNPSTAAATAGIILTNNPSDWNNPYFDAYENLNLDDRDRFFGDINLSYQVLPELKLSGFVRSDMYVQRLRNYRALGGRFIGGTADGYSEGKYQNTENNYEFLAQYNKSFGDISLNVNAGANLLTQEYSYLSQSTAGGLVSPGWFNIAASVDRPVANGYLRKKQVRSVYGMASLGYKDIYFIDATIRNDVSSALPSNNNSYVYPSVSGSVVFSELLKWKPLSFGKFRMSYAVAGSDLSAYEISPVYVAGTVYTGTPVINTQTLPSVLRNPNIEPSFANSFEVGTELKFLNNRVGLDFTYYNQLNENQIINLTVSPASGYGATVVNAGKIRNKGIELSLNAIPIKSNNFTWNTVLNFNKNNNMVEELHPDVKLLTLGSNVYSNQTVFLYAEEGKEFGSIVGPGYAKDPSTGKILLDAADQPVRQLGVDFGSAIPDFTGGFRNTFKYKNLDLGVMIDFQKGGNFMSWTNMLAAKAGTAEITAAMNDKGFNIREPLANGGGVKVSGIYAPGTIKTINSVPTNVGGQEFTGYVDAREYYRNRLGTYIYDEWIYDASYIKLREVTLGYTLSNKLLAKTPFSSVRIAAIARNPLMIWQKAPKGVDPSELSSGSGSVSWIEKGELQTVRSFGFNLSVKF